MDNNQIIKDLAKKFNKDVRVIEHITKHPFKFLYQVMGDPDDNRPVRLMYFGTFVQKNTKNKDKYYNDLRRLRIEKLMGYR